MNKHPNPLVNKCREICKTPRYCIDKPGMLPSSCLDCGWDADEATNQLTSKERYELDRWIGKENGHYPKPDDDDDDWLDWYANRKLNDRR